VTRLPPLPELNWKDDGTPEATAHGDIYFSRDGGLDETRAVFLAGNGLPERWTGRERFTIAELGFGTGLNFLAAWQMWLAHRPSPTAHLHFVSFEGFPLDAADAARALTAWPELAPLSEKLTQKWPHRARGVRRIDWPEDGISLTLHIDEIAAALPASRLKADAWFLDGFSPAKNTAMWDDAIYPLIAKRSATGATIGTYTVAGHVRRGLSEAGFTVQKAPGYGRKRDRLEASIDAPPPAPSDFYGLRSPASAPRKVAILGAGIAGASLAHALAARGADVHVFDPSGPASGASGNPMALAMPRLDAADTVQARLLIDAYLHARAFYKGLPGAELGEVRQMPRDEKETARFAKVLADPPLPLEDLEAIAGGGLLHKQAIILRPKTVIEALLSSQSIALNGSWSGTSFGTSDHDFDAVTHASGMAVNASAPWLDMTPKRGQVEHIDDAPRTAPAAVASGHYAITSGKERLWGATFEAASEPILTDAARFENNQKLGELAPWIATEARTRTQTSRASIRATTPDRLPLIGALPDEPSMRETFAAYAKGQQIQEDAPLMPKQYIATGYGSRGFTWAPWAASILTAQLFGEPAPASQPALEAVSPARLILRALKRGT